jgi:hypothetical protein
MKLGYKYNVLHHMLGSPYVLHQCCYPGYFQCGGQNDTTQHNYYSQHCILTTTGHILQLLSRSGLLIKHQLEVKLGTID